MTSIGDRAFKDCSGLKNIYYTGSQKEWNKISIDENGNDCLTSATIHYDFVVSTDPTPGGSDDSTDPIPGGTGDSEPITPGGSDNSGTTTPGGTGSSEATTPGGTGGSTDTTPGSPGGSDSSTDTTPGGSTPPAAETPAKTAQTITAKNITKTYGAKAFSLGAKSNAGTNLTYSVSDKKVATVDKKGKVTIKGCGITNITITAPETDTYSQAQTTVKLTVKPKKVTVSFVKSIKKKTATVKWKKDNKASGYLVEFATDSKFKKNKVCTTVNKNKTLSATVKKLKPGKKYYVRVCAYAKSGKTKVQGDWSKVKTVKVKK